MIDDPEIFESRGHNQGPDLPRTELEDQIAALEPYRARRDQFIAAARAAVIRDRHDAGAAASIVRMAGQVFDQIDRDAKARRAPIRQLADDMKGAVDGFWAEVEGALEALEQKVSAFLDGEDEKIATQAAEQRAFLGDIGEGEQRARSLPIRGDYHGRVTRVDRTELYIVDRSALPSDVLEHPTVEAAILAVVSSRVDGAKLPGIGIRKIKQTRVR